jgi:hypothetical protein
MSALDTVNMSTVARSTSLLGRLPLAKLGRAMAVSIITTALSLTILIVLTATKQLTRRWRMSSQRSPVSGRRTR